MEKMTFSQTVDKVLENLAGLKNLEWNDYWKAVKKVDNSLSVLSTRAVVLAVQKHHNN